MQLPKAIYLLSDINGITTQAIVYKPLILCSLLIYILTLLNHIALFSYLLEDNILDEHLDAIFLQSVFI